MKNIYIISSILIIFLTCSRKSQDMIFVEGGSFLMGDRVEEGHINERPVHSVIVNSFYISKFEVTVLDFSNFTKATGYKTTAEQEGWASISENGRFRKADGVNWKNPNLEQTERHPVVCVSWIDAIEYCNWKSTLEKLNTCYTIIDDSVICNFEANGYRLPTEAEWEYAARGGKLSKGYKYSGSNNFLEVAWCDTNSNNTTHPVGGKKENELGLFDMSGNVWEWCWDKYNKDDDYYSRSPINNPKGVPTGNYRILRGGSWLWSTYHARISYRHYYWNTVRFFESGFRVCRSAI